MNDQIVTKKPLWRRILRKIFFVGIFLIVAIIASISIWNYRAAKQVDEEIAKIRKAGEPVTFQDLEARLPKVDQAENANRFYQAGMDLQVYREERELSSKLAEYAKKNVVPDKETLEKIGKYLEENRLALEMFDRGKELPECRSEITAKNGISVMLPQLSSPRSAARLIALRSRYLAASGKPDEAVDSIISSLRFTRVVNEQTMLIAYLVKIACLGVAHEDVKIVLQVSHPSEKSLAKLQQELLKTDKPWDFEKMILAERVYGIETMGVIPIDENNPTQLPERWSKSLRSSPWLKQESLDYLRNMSQNVITSRKPWPEFYNEMLILSPKGMTAKILNPAFARVAMNVDRGLATGRSAYTAVAIARYRLANNKLPEKLSDLVPAYMQKIPMDPFTGKDILYRHNNESYTVYSAYKNKKDDQGAIESQEALECKDDGVKINLQ